MIVRDLIDILVDCPEDAEVVTSDMRSITEVKVVRELDGVICQPYIILRYDKDNFFKRIYEK